MNDLLRRPRSVVVALALLFVLVSCFGDDNVDDGSVGSTVSIVEPSPSCISVPNVVGLQVHDAVAVIEQAGLRVETRLQDDAVVASQEPQSGSSLRRGDVVEVSSEPSTTTSGAVDLACSPSDGH